MKKLKMKKKDKREIANAFALFSTIGINMVVCIGISLFFGTMLDKFFHTDPIFLLIFIIIGIMACLKNIYKLGMSITVPKNKDDK